MLVAPRSYLRACVAYGTYLRNRNVSADILVPEILYLTAEIGVFARPEQYNT